LIQRRLTRRSSPSAAAGERIEMHASLASFSKTNSKTTHIDSKKQLTQHISCL
jgi:hypothetical protein